MSLVQLDRISKSFGVDVLFDPFSAPIDRGDRIALIGDNGVGKSTLLRMIAGEERPTEGGVRIIGETRIGYLSQTARLGSHGSLWEAVEGAFSDVRETEQELRQLERDIAHGADDETLHRYDDLLHRFARDGGYEVEKNVRAALTGVGFAPEDHVKPVAVLSGGEEARAALARNLVEQPDILLLDEPTNHLDFAALDWLEEQLLRFAGAIVLVSHDRHLLERVTNRTWEIAFDRVSVYTVGYTHSRELRDAERRRQLELYQDQEETIEKYKDFVRRHKMGQKHRQAKDREKKLQRIEKDRIEEPKEARRIHLSISVGKPSGKRLLSLHDLAVGYDSALFSCPDVEVYTGERIAIIGPNGSGKTTLLKTISGERTPLRGTVRLGHNVQPAEYSQTQEGLHGSNTVLEAILARASLTLGEARGLLGRFLFSGDDVNKKVKALSGGERSRVALALLSLIEGNLLLLDEPTNHLDLASQEILEQALIEYPGTILLVSHDRALLEALTTQVWLVQDDRLVVHSYGYAEYRRRHAEAVTNSPEKEPQHRTDSTPLEPKRAKPDKYRARKSEQAREEAESKIEDLERELERIENDLAAASASGDGQRIAALATDHKNVKQRLSTAYEAWEALAETSS